jgi:CRP/FNR family transcriptional regulator, cyclic AMP receptor protein
MSTTAPQREELQFPKGSVIFRQGDFGNEMFVVSEGRIRLTIGKPGHEKEVNVIGPGEFFGELSLLSEDPRSATATAVEDSRLLAIGRDVFAMMVQDDLDIVFRMFNIQGQRLSRTNVPLEELAAQMGRVRVAAHFLRRLWQTGTRLPLTVDIDELGKGFSGNPRAVEDTVQDLVERGVGELHERAWTIQTREQIATLLEALTEYAGS